MRLWWPRSRRRRLDAAAHATTKAIGGAHETKSLLAAYYNALYQSGLSGTVRRRWPVERAVEEGYERVTWVFKAVQAISTNTARLPFRLVHDEQPVDDHPLYRLLNQQANPLETGRQFRQRLAAQILLSKAGAFVEVTYSNMGTPIRLDLLPPGRTRIIPGNGQELISQFEVIRADGTRSFVPPERVRWFRDPHPLDPYSGITPLEAAGLAVELDHFADLYNATFVRNDGRPGGVLSVGPDMPEQDMRRIEDRFSGRGPWEAGKLSVVTGDLDYVDVAKSPRDMAYGDLSTMVKNKILTAFGTPESVLGNASGRTFANADQEEENWWRFTLLPLLDLIAAEFDSDSDDELIGEFVTDDVEALQRAKALRRQEAREEFQAGLISPDEYREIAGYPLVDNAYARALYVAAGRTPLPTREEDAATLGLAGPPDAAGGPDGGAEPLPDGAVEPIPPPGVDPGGSPPGGPGGAAGAAGDAAAWADPGGMLPPAAGPTGAVGPVVPPNPYALPAAPPLPAAMTAPGTPGGPGGGGGSGLEAKTVPVPARARWVAAKVTVLRPHRAALRAERDAGLGQDERARLTRALSAVLAASAMRLTERAAARAESPKLRKHTRHWAATYATDTRVGTKALDAERAVDAGRWVQEMTTAVRPHLNAAAAAGLDIDAAVAAAAAAATDLAGRVTTQIRGGDQAGEAIGQITERVRAGLSAVPGWADQAAAAVVAAARAGNPAA